MIWSGDLWKTVCRTSLTAGRKLCIDNDEEFERLLLHTDVRWLSKGNCLKRFYSLFDTVVEFFQDSNHGLCDDLKNIKDDIAYLSDIFNKFNEVNLQLQGNDSTLSKSNLLSPV